MSGTQHPDNDPTDELPILSDIAVAEFEADAVRMPRGDANGESADGTVQFPGPLHATVDAEEDTLPAPSVLPVQSFESLERELAGLTKRWSSLEGQLAESASAVGALTRQLAITQRALGESSTAQQHLQRTLDAKDTELAALRVDHERLTRDNGALREAVERFAADKESLTAQLGAAVEEQSARTDLASALGERRALEAQLEQARARIVEIERNKTTELEQAQAQAAELEAELTAAHQLIEEMSTPKDDDGSDSDAYRAELAALSDYITNRRNYWNEMEDRLKSQRERIAELETEVEHRRGRQQAAELVAQREAELATSLKARLSDLAEQLAAARSETTQPEPAPESVPAAATRRIEELEEELDAKSAELEVQRERLSDTEQQAAEARERLAELGRELNEARAQAQSTEEQLRTLEERLAAREHETDVHEERISALQRDLGEQLDSLRNLAKAQSTRHAAPLSGANGAETHATLVCLTSEQPQEYAIAKPITTIGRSGECDIQIMTHFVSREHARLLATEDGISIEDLGSTNGVFVNSVRVEQQPLHHGDWITIGETQFRFLSSGQV